jgi:hypothetical protein
MPSKKAINNPGLCPVKGQNLALVPRQGSQINSQACLWVLPRPRLAWERGEMHTGFCWKILKEKKQIGRARRKQNDIKMDLSRSRMGA